MVAPARPSPTWLRALLERHGCSQLGAARLLRAEPKSVRRWLSGERPMGWRDAELLRRLLDERNGQEAMWSGA